MHTHMLFLKSFIQVELETSNALDCILVKYKKKEYISYIFRFRQLYFIKNSVRIKIYWFLNLYVFWNFLVIFVVICVKL